MFKFPSQLNRKCVHGSSSTESEHQISLIQWVRETEALQTDPIKRESLHFLHAVPNGGGRGKPYTTRSGRRLPPLQAVQLKAEGVVPGIFDLRLDYIAQCPGAHTDHPEHYYGLLIEMKSGKGALTPDQSRYMKHMEGMGFVCRVRRTWQSAARDITGYMSLTKIAPVFVMAERDHMMQVTDPLLLLGLEAVQD